jgi:hypothetical protein
MGKEKTPFDIATEIHRLGALMEAQGDDIRLVAEEVGGIRKTQDKHTRILERHGQMFGEIQADIAGIKSDVSELKTDVAVLKEDVSVLKADVSILKADVSVLKSDVSVLKDDMGSKARSRLK